MTQTEIEREAIIRTSREIARAKPEHFEELRKIIRSEDRDAYHKFSVGAYNLYSEGYLSDREYRKLRLTFLKPTEEKIKRRHG